MTRLEATASGEEPWAAVRSGTVTVPGRQERRPRPVLWWAAAGVVAVLVQAEVYGSWILSDDFRPVPTGPDPVPTADKVWAWILQISFTAMALIAIGYVVRGCLRQRRLTLDAKLFCGFVSLFWLDPTANWIRPQWSYNAYYVNRGSWTEHIPGWIAQTTGRVPQSLLVEAPAYMMMILLAVSGCAFMRWVKRRRPETSHAGLVMYLWLFMGVFVFLFEWPLMIKTGFARYLQVPTFPGASLFAGSESQYPWFEVVAWSGMNTAMTSLRYFVNDRGETAVEQGLRRVRGPAALRTAISTFAIVGFATACMAAYALVVAPLTLWGNTTPDLPSYYHTELCDSPGTDPCPGPDVPIRLR